MGFIKRNFSFLLIVLLIPFFFMVHLKMGKWEEPRKLINFDTKSYYAYFPAVFIEKDHKMDFLNDESHPNKFFYYGNTRTETGNRIIVTSCGMAMLYSPFALIAHYLTAFTTYKQNGFSIPYALALVYSNMFYLIAGLFFLRKLLLRFFNDWIVGLSILAILFGTNLIYYATYEMTMPHAYIFSLSAIYLYYVDSWYEKPNYWKSILIGLISGLIVLVRPNNILILILLLFWGVNSFKDFSVRFKYGFKMWRHIIVMVFAFIFIWTPQLIYWYSITGKVFYFSYSVIGGSFYFNNPQIFNQLFSYRSGILLYSPIIVFGYVGLFLFKHSKTISLISVLIYTAFTYYILACWWSWWNGGSFGIRSFIDSYLAIVFGFAVFMQFVSNQKKYLSYPILFLFLLLIPYGSFRAWQYTKGIIHYDTNTKEMYFKSLFSLKRVNGYWDITKVYRPDYFLGKCGINAYQGIEYDNSTRQNRLINEIRRIQNDVTLYNKYLSEAQSKKMNVYKHIRRIAEEKIGK
jgi:hypothetical protein